MNPLIPETFPLRGQHLIEASAGTGKTYTITNLYLRLLLGRDEQLTRPMTVDEILVLTFTVAATEELRDRIRNRINEARAAFAAGDAGNDDFLHWLLANSDDPRSDSRLLTAAVQLMDEASIFTIHGFCVRVLSDNAFETGALFDQSLDADRDELLEQAVHDCFRSEIITLPPMHQATALNLWATPEKLMKQVKGFLFRPTVEYFPSPAGVDEQTAAGTLERLKRTWREEREAFRAALDSAGYAKNTKIITRLDLMDAWCESNDIEFEDLGVWSTDELTSRRHSGPTPESDIPGLIDDVITQRSRIETDLWHRVISRLKENLERYKVEQSELTLDDLLTQVRKAQLSPVGDRLSRELAQRWPVAMVDEFQDTDDVQWEIFADIWQHHGIGLYLIGDPKQAIYQFRGADVFTYINAKRAIASHFSLDTNWRSRPPLVDAVNALFTKAGVFGNDDDIPFEPVKASPVADKLTIEVNGETLPPISIGFLPNDAGNAETLRRLAMDHAAERTRQLLSSETLINGKPIHAGQIAFLVRSGTDAKAARAALSRRNIRSVYVTLESVFLTDTADDLRLILHAVLEPNNLSAVKAALATRLMQCTASDILALSENLDIQHDTMQEFSEYHRLWNDMDVATMIATLLHRRDIARKWMNAPNGDRQLTNLRHLTEILQQRAAVAPGMHRLFKWFSREKREANTVAADERQLRLESDRDLVKIVTMHASKGLQYEVVMIPVAGFTAPSASTREPVLVHELEDGSFRARLDLAASENSQAQATAEQQDEDMRLLYVAITRARHHCYLGVTGLGKNAADRSAIGKLLESPRNRMTAAQLNERWQPPLFEAETIGNAPLTLYVPRDSALPLRPPPAPPSILTTWRMHSYTGVARLITRDAERDAHHAQPGFGDDEEESATAGPSISRFAFPRGPRVGVALHTLMEHLDFARDAREQLSLLDQCLDRVSLLGDRDAWRQVMIDWLNDIRTSEIDGFALADVDPACRLDEMEFHFPVNVAGDLLALLRDAGYCRDRELDVTALSGMMTGMIDLVFEHGGRFYLVDYKSNHLGDSANDYLPAQLGSAIAHHLYDLQYLIYSVALDRYLTTRVPGYQFDTHFGGASYLFLRGLDGSTSRQGVFTDRPDGELIKAFSATLGGRT